VDSALNDLIEFMLGTKAEWFLLMASDAAVHPLAVERLLSWDKPLVAALSFLRYAPILPAVYRAQNEKGQFRSEVELVIQWIREHPHLMALNEPALLEPRPEGALLEVRRFGTHVTLIHREVLEAIEPPWFKRQSEFGSGEDFYFVEQAEAAGYQPYVDLSQVAAHKWGDWVLGALDFMVWAKSVDWDTGECLIEVDVEV